MIRPPRRTKCGRIDEPTRCVNTGPVLTQNTLTLEGSGLVDIVPPPMPPGIDTGRPCPRYSNGGRIKRRATPARVRRAVALRYGATPGRRKNAAPCQYCGAIGNIFWPTRLDGQPGAWVHFRDLALDHIVPYSKGGSTTDPDNFVLACQRCNSSKGDRLLSEWTGVKRGA